MTIDPHNLGAPVYKENQVVTASDLKRIINELVNGTLGQEMTVIETERFDAAIATLTNMLDWLQLGKPKYMPKGEDHDGL